MGKTAFVLNIAQHVAFRQNLAVAIFSLEMSKEQLVNRMFSLGLSEEELKKRGVILGADVLLYYAGNVFWRKGSERS